MRVMQDYQRYVSTMGNRENPNLKASFIHFCPALFMRYNTLNQACILEEEMQVENRRWRSEVGIIGAFSELLASYPKVVQGRKEKLGLYSIVSCVTMDITKPQLLYLFFLLLCIIYCVSSFLFQMSHAHLLFNLSSLTQNIFISSFLLPTSKPFTLFLLLSFLRHITDPTQFQFMSLLRKIKE